MSKKLLLSLFSFLLVAIFVPRSSQALGLNQVELSFVATSTTLPPNSTIKLTLNPHGYQIGFVDLAFNFDPAKLQITGEITPGTALKTIVSKTPMAEANQTGHVSLTIAISGDDQASGLIPTTTFDLATFTITPKNSTASTTTISLAPTGVQIIDIKSVNLSTSSSPLYLTLNANQPPTPTPHYYFWQRFFQRFRSFFHRN